MQWEVCRFRSGGSASQGYHHQSYHHQGNRKIEKHRAIVHPLMDLQGAILTCSLYLCTWNLKDLDMMTCNAPDLEFSCEFEITVYSDRPFDSFVVQTSICKSPFPLYLFIPSILAHSLDFSYCFGCTLGLSYRFMVRSFKSCWAGALWYCCVHDAPPQDAS